MNDKNSPLLEVPEEARDSVKRILERPKFLARLLIEEAEKLEKYALLEPNESVYSRNYDAWGNCVTIAEDCRGKAKFYRRIVNTISPKEEK